MGIKVFMCLRRLFLLILSAFAAAPEAQGGADAPAAPPAARGAAADAGGQTGAAGTWLGTLSVGPAELRLGLIVTEDAGGRLRASLNSIDQGGVTLPADEIMAADGGKVRFELKLIGASFDGKLSDDRKAIEGTFTQNGADLPLKFERVDSLPTVKRPQEPKRPYPYREEFVEFENKAAPRLSVGAFKLGTIKLSGTLTLPPGPGPHPAVVLISGSGPQDRDETVMNHRPFLVLADHLTRHGVAVLRYDDRGVGKSQGDFSTATSADFATDALAAVAFLKAHKEIDPKRIGFIGHSEGGIVAPLAVARSPADVAFVVLMAGVGVPMDQLLIRQAKDITRTGGIPDDLAARMVELQRKAFKLLKEEDDPAAAERGLRALMGEAKKSLTEEQRKAMNVTEGSAEMQVKMMTSPWFRELLRYDPAATLAQVKCPVLAVNGQKDVQVAADENLPAIRVALEKGGNKGVEIVELPGLNHLFQPCQTGGVGEYAAIEQTMAPEALDVVTKWVRRQVGLGDDKVTR